MRIIQFLNFCQSSGQRSWWVLIWFGPNQKEAKVCIFIKALYLVSIEKGNNGEIYWKCPEPNCSVTLVTSYQFSLNKINVKNINILNLLFETYKNSHCRRNETNYVFVGEKKTGEMSLNRLQQSRYYLLIDFLGSKPLIQRLASN